MAVAYCKFCGARRVGVKPCEIKSFDNYSCNKPECRSKRMKEVWAKRKKK